MDALALVDAFGVLSPHAMKYFVSFFVGRIFCGEPVSTPGSSPGASFAGKCSRVQKRIKKRLEAHFHQDFGMGVANTIMALSLGVLWRHFVASIVSRGRHEFILPHRVLVKS